jgi:hypothetical protein
MTWYDLISLQYIYYYCIYTGMTFTNSRIIFCFGYSGWYIWQQFIHRFPLLFHWWIRYLKCWNDFQTCVLWVKYFISSVQLGNIVVFFIIFYIFGSIGWCLCNTVNITTKQISQVNKNMTFVCIMDHRNPIHMMMKAGIAPSELWLFILRYPYPCVCL